MSWLKKGAEAAQMYDRQEKEYEERKSQGNKLWRYFLKQGEEGRLTFIDGDLDKDGILNAVTWREHGVFMNGSWNNRFVCTADDEPCPICEMQNSPSLVSALTIIDHRTTKSKDGTKVYKDQVRLFVFKSETRKLLQLIAAKRGGLAGATFDVMRPNSKKTPSVGQHFDFIEKTPLDMLRMKYTRKNEKGETVTIVVPADYASEIGYKSAKELRAMGFGIGGHIVGAEKAPSDDDDQHDSQSDVSQHL